MALPPKANPLIEFDKDHPARRSSGTWMERELPPEVLEWCREAWIAGVRGTNMVAWLKSQGYAGATGGRISAYFKKHPVE